ncbi:MAG: DNA polymerase-3 subunit epsilon [Paraglaciecola sp.]|jgi:DNA polymerase-3 subunit epsilon
MIILPEKYYLDHFNEFIFYIEQHCSALLLDEHQQFISAFRQLEHNAQCMLVRVINRRGEFIAKDKLHYDEIKNGADTLVQLAQRDFLRALTPEDGARLLPNLLKSQLMDLLATCDIHYTKNASKSTLLALALQLDIHRVIGHALFSRYGVKACLEQWQYLLFLYFGDLVTALDKFSMRDMGIFKTRKKPSQQGARFNHLSEAQSAYFFARHIQNLPLANDHQLLQLGQSDVINKKPQGSLAHEYAAEFLYLLGLALLPIDQATALGCWRVSSHQKARQRWIRETYKADKNAAKLALENILHDPQDDELSLFAFDFYQRKFNQAKLSVRTRRLRENSRKLNIDEIYKNRVEYGVQQYYRDQSVRAYRTENGLFRALFGLTFWNELFDVAQRATGSEFDRRPRLVRENRLYSELAECVEQRLALFARPKQALLYLTNVATAHYGQPNGMFYWHNRMLELITVLINHVSGDCLIQHLRAMAKNYQGLKDGYPDLMVIENKQLRFEEIKAPGDQLRANQLVSIDALQQAGFEVGVCQVQWCYNPQQPYVVVDVETTGGCSAGHRITEIGVVKVIDGRVVDSWSSLINPQRSIPASITRLTGISDAMVHTAPLFCDVLDSLENFMDGGIFVAHNVNFDYGFFKLEYARLERKFSLPKLCTVREMRKYFPGSASYSLGKLSKEYNLSLDTHHRALCDAQAAAELLIMVNEKKQNLPIKTASVISQ